jgi:hypothetical protein
MLATQLVVLYLLLANGGWVYDDNLIMILGRRTGFTWGWLHSLIYQHWGIGYHAVFSAFVHLMPFDYRWSLALMLILLGGSIYLTDRVITMLFGGRWLGLVCAGYVGFSILFVRPLQWSAGGIQYLPNTFFDLLCLYGYVRFQLDHSRRWAFLSAAALAGGLLFYEKPAYMLLYLVLIRVLLFTEELRWRTLLRGFWEERVIWGGLLITLCAWAIGFRLSGGGVGVASGTVSLTQYLQYFKILWVQTLVPAMVGLTLPQTGLDALQIVLAVVFQIGLLIAVAWSLKRKRSAWRAYAFLVIVVLLTGGLVARTRVAQFGVGIGGDLRYLLDFAWLLPLVGCFAFSPGVTVTPRAFPRTRSIEIRPRVRAALLLVMVAVIGYSAAGIATTAKLQREWAAPAARSWEARVMNGLASLRTKSHRVVVADAAGPFFMVPPAFAPFNLLSSVLPLYDRQVQVDGVLRGAFAQVDQLGGVHPAAFGAPLGDGRLANLIRTHQVVMSANVRVSEHGGRTCLFSGATPGTITRRLVVAPTSHPVGLYLHVSYMAVRSASLPVLITGTDVPGIVQRQLQVIGGPGQTEAFLVSNFPKQVTLALLPDNPLCIRRFDVAPLVPVS